MIKSSKIGWLSVAMLLLMACGGGQKKEFNRLLLDVADKDEVIDATEWEQIVEFLDGLCLLTERLHNLLVTQHFVDEGGLLAARLALLATE